MEFTNPDRVLYPEIGLTKRDLWRYYEIVAEHILPHIVDRPLTLLRCPSGRQRSCFIQRHLPESPPEHLTGVPVSGEDREYMALEGIDGLAMLVQLGTLEIHTWGARASDPDRPDRLVFDIDPHEALPFTRTVEAAKAVREILMAAGLTSFVKTTGGKGLHVVAPIVPDTEWDEAKDFCRAVARLLEEQNPDSYTSVMSKARRKGKVYVDYLRNARAASAVAAYSTRNRPGAPIAMPLSWEQLTARLNPERFTVKTAASELKRRKDDPWAAMLTLEQRVEISRVP